MHNRRKNYPVSDSRTVDNPDNPKHSYLNSPRGASLDDPHHDSTVSAAVDDHDVKSGPVSVRREIARPINGEVMKVIHPEIKVGTGLVKSKDDEISVNADLSHVTTIGSLIKLNVSGPATFTKEVTIPEATLDNHPVTMRFAKSLEINVGKGLIKTKDNKISIDGFLLDSIANKTFVQNNISKLASIDYVNKKVSELRNGLRQIEENVHDVVKELASETYVQDAISELASKTYVKELVDDIEAGVGLKKIGKTFSVSPDQSHVTKVGSLTGIRVTGPIVTPMECFSPQDGETVKASRRSTGVILNSKVPMTRLTVVFPESPVDGQQFSLHTTHGIDELTAQATFATGNLPPAAMTPGYPLRYIYSSEVEGWLVL